MVPGDFNSPSKDGLKKIIKKIQTPKLLGAFPNKPRPGGLGLERAASAQRQLEVGRVQPRNRSSVGPLHAQFYETRCE